MSKINTQWHPAFCSALRLELSQNKNDLHFQSEYGINTKPILIDLLIIKKLPNILIQNEIGKIFKGHNILEYKSPQDSLNIDVFFKAIAYASLYKANASTVDGIKANDITISLIREQKPQKLLNQLSKAGLHIQKTGKGFYSIQNIFFFAIQIIVSKELDKEEHVWLTSLTKSLDMNSAQKLVLKMEHLTEKDEKEFADSILQVVMKENKNLFQKAKGVASMCEALKELMAPELKQAKQEAQNKGRQEGIQEGMQAGIHMLANTILRLRNGDSEEMILASGVDKSTLALALTLK